MTLTSHAGVPLTDRRGKTYEKKLGPGQDPHVIAGRLTKQRWAAKRDNFQHLFIIQIWVLLNSCPSRNLTLTVSVQRHVAHSKTRASQSTSSVMSIRESSIGNPHEGQWCGSKCGGNFDLSKLDCDMARARQAHVYALRPLLVPVHVVLLRAPDKPKHEKR